MSCYGAQQQFETVCFVLCLFVSDTLALSLQDKLGWLIARITDWKRRLFETNLIKAYIKG